MTMEVRLGVLRQEILRWNRQISLVSRSGTRRTVDTLVAQCRRAWTLVGSHLDAREFPGGRCWIDVGSGSGLPGLVWAAEDAETGSRDPFILVEPRRKRAWFLNRAARAMGLGHVVVSAARWGEPIESLDVRGASIAVVSFKALRMGDREVLDGLDAPGLVGIQRAVIVRFLGEDPADGEDLMDHLGEDAADHPGPCGWLLDGGEFLGAGDPRLLVVHYRRA